MEELSTVKNYITVTHNENPAKRESNFELLRIFSMVIIITHHLLVQGISNYELGSFSNKITGAIMFPGGRIGVALFFMLTGYFLIGKKKTSVKRVFLETIFYGWFLSLFLIIPYSLDKICGFSFNYCSLKAIFRKILVPVSSGRWWFVTAYCLLILTVPYINLFLEKLNKSGFKFFIFISWFFWYSADTFLGADIGLIPAFFFYIFGAYFRLYSSKKKNIALNLFSAVFLWGLISIYYFHFDHAVELNSKKQEIVKLLFYFFTHSFFIPLCAWNLFSIFSSIKLKYNNFINTVASTTFGVYLIHVSSVKTVFYRDFFKINEQYLSPFFPLWAILDLTVMFSLCAIIDYFRLKFIEPKMIKKADAIFEKMKKRFFS